MYKVNVPIDFQQTLSNIYGEETYQMNYKALFWFNHSAGRNQAIEPGHRTGHRTGHRIGRNHSKILD